MCSVIYHNEQRETSHFPLKVCSAMTWCMEIDENFRRNLKRLREEQRLDARTLSKMAGMGERGVKDIEEGRSQSPKISTAYRLADALGVDLPTMMGLKSTALLVPDLVEFLAQYDQGAQRQMLAALTALPRLPG